MTKPLLLHIGSPKTGTTSIQEALFLNASHLREQGIAIPVSLGFGAPNQIALPMACTSPAEQGHDFINRYGFIGAEGRARLIDTVRTLMRKDLDGAPFHRVLATSEHFWFLSSDHHFNVLSGLLSDLDLELTNLVVYLRPQSLFLASAMPTLLRDGRISCQFSANEATQFSYLNYDKMLSGWQKHFPNAQIQIVNFEAKKKQLIPSFLATCELPELPRPAPYMNAGLSNIGCEQMAKLNRTWPRMIKRGGGLAIESPLHSMIADWLNKHCPGKFELDNDSSEIIFSIFKESNKLVYQKFGLDFNLQPGASGGQKKSSDARLDNPSLDSISRLIMATEDPNLGSFLEEQLCQREAKTAYFHTTTLLKKRQPDNLSTALQLSTRAVLLNPGFPPFWDLYWEVCINRFKPAVVSAEMLTLMQASIPPQRFNVITEKYKLTK
jgi:hypothetical protein